MGYSPWDCKESDTTEGLTLSLAFQNNTHIHTKRDKGAWSEKALQEPSRGREFPEGPPSVLGGRQEGLAVSWEPQGGQWGRSW